jgi:UDP-N-acetylmuramoylalanine--D-glutamate ligase
VTVMGLGLLGRGVGDAAFLAQCGAEVLVTDLKTREQLRKSLKKLRRYKNISYALSGHRLDDFRYVDFILKAAGVPLNSPYIAAARKNGVPVYMSTALFAKFAHEIGVTVVGVTGTRGKSTITHLIYHSLKKAGRKVHLGGNVKGVSTLALLPKIKKGDMCVLELDSWQLQGFGDLKISPQVAVFTNLLDDHLNYYRSTSLAVSRKLYFADKVNIFRFQKKGDALIAGTGIAEQIKKAKPLCAPIVPAPLSAEVRLNILGEHNRENAGLAAAALCILGLSKTEIRKGLESFMPVEGRLQYLRTVRGIKIYNDNNATTPDATSAALKALGKDIVLIMGGTDKGLDMNKLVAEILKHCKGVVMLKESGTEKIKRKVAGVEKDTLKECVEEAIRLAKKGDSILFSPAFASFGKWFKNEYDRNDQFVKIVEKL